MSKPILTKEQVAYEIIRSHHTDNVYVCPTCSVEVYAPKGKAAKSYHPICPQAK